jgi:glyoxylase I family protein
MPVIQHFAMNCRDRIAQERFYRTHVGFVRARVFNHREPNEFVMLRLEDFRLELFSSDAAPDAVGGEQPVGFKHLAFAVDDLDEKIAQLTAAGIDVDPIIDCDKICPGMRVCFFRDPEGNMLELMEGYADQMDVPEL